MENAVQKLRFGCHCPLGAAFLVVSVEPLGTFCGECSAHHQGQMSRSQATCLVLSADTLFSLCSKVSLHLSSRTKTEVTSEVTWLAFD